ncbi:MAG TPA: hypothetical protein VG123_05575 [Streptosporangiaceae bacterium]|nr:hypothetical protein [Streptosporangiaceae bacterium]
MRRKTWVAAGVLASAFTIFDGGSAFAAAGWTTVSIPATGNNTDLHGVFARTNTDAWAVGQQFVAAGQAPAPPAIYHWNGTAWSLVSSPALPQASALVAVSASSATDAWAVGGEKAGRGHQTLLEHWNGTAWSVDTADSVPGGLGAVLDLSTANAYAVGNASGSRLEHWNGASWSPVTLPDSSFVPGSLQTISATSASDIWLVGTSAGQSEALHFNGTAWTVVPMAQPPASPFGSSVEIGAVTAISPADAWAVGEATGNTLIEHWDGTSWSIVPSPTPGADPALTGVAARSATDVYAVGQEPGVNGGPFRAVILRWNGTAWTDDTGGATFGVTEAAATFPGAAREWAVGITSGNQGQILSHG